MLEVRAYIGRKCWKWLCRTDYAVEADLLALKEKGLMCVNEDKTVSTIYPWHRVTKIEVRHAEAE